MIDLSDGLHADLTRICKASGVGAIVDPDKLPIGPLAASLMTQSPSTAFGEDYQYLFTTLPTMDNLVKRYAREASVNQRDWQN